MNIYWKHWTIASHDDIIRNVFEINVLIMCKTPSRTMV